MTKDASICKELGLIFIEDFCKADREAWNGTVEKKTTWLYEYGWAGNFFSCYSGGVALVKIGKLWPLKRLINLYFEYLWSTQLKTN